VSSTNYLFMGTLIKWRVFFLTLSFFIHSFKNSVIYSFFQYIDRVTPAWMNQGSGPSTVPISYSLPSTGPQRERSRSRERIAQSIDPRLAARGQQSSSSSSSSSLNISNYSSIAPTSSSHIPDAFSQLRNLAEKHGGNIQFPFQDAGCN
jgi:hypothetical protein